MKIALIAAAVLAGLAATSPVRAAVVTYEFLGDLAHVHDEAAPGQTAGYTGHFHLSLSFDEARLGQSLVDADIDDVFGRGGSDGLDPFPMAPLGLSYSVSVLDASGAQIVAPSRGFYFYYSLDTDAERRPEDVSLSVYEGDREFFVHSTGVSFDHFPTIDGAWTYRSFSFAGRFALSSVEEFVAEPAPTHAPVPAAMPLLAAGLAGLALIRRRRRPAA